MKLSFTKTSNNFPVVGIIGKHLKTKQNKKCGHSEGGSLERVNQMLKLRYLIADVLFCFLRHPFYNNKTIIMTTLIVGELYINIVSINLKYDIRINFTVYPSHQNYRWWLRSSGSYCLLGLYHLW